MTYVTVNVVLIKYDTKRIFVVIAVTEIQCTFSNTNSLGSRDSIVAKLKKPDGFRGSPLFADDRAVDPDNDPSCQIRADHTDPTGLRYNLRITDFTRCGVLKRNVSLKIFNIHQICGRSKKSRVLVLISLLCIKIKNSLDKSCLGLCN